MNVSQITSLDLDESDLRQLSEIVSKYGGQLTQDDLWRELDEAWRKHGCDYTNKTRIQRSAFYSDKVWMLNAVYSELDPTSIYYREAAAKSIKVIKNSDVLDYGGGGGGLAKAIAIESPSSRITIFDPFPSSFALRNISRFPNIRFSNEMHKDSFDVVVCTDVLEHLEQPLLSLRSMVTALRFGGYLVIGNCFYPVIKCHLPSTFHLRVTFSLFCMLMGLKKVGQCEETYIQIYRKSFRLCSPVFIIVAAEYVSRLYFNARCCVRILLNKYT